MMQVPESKKPHISTSKEITTLLHSYNLCESAISCHNILEKHIHQSLFYAAVITYYSIFKSHENKDWFLSALREVPDFFVMRNPFSLSKNQQLNEKIEEIFKKYENIRDKNIAHKDENRREEDGLAFLKVPNGIGGGDMFSDGELFITQKSFISFSLVEQKEFLTLVGVTLDMFWKKEGLSIYKQNSDGAIQAMPPSLHPKFKKMEEAKKYIKR